jgi:hypothetical protein
MEELRADQREQRLREEKLLAQLMELRTRHGKIDY